VGLDENRAVLWRIFSEVVKLDTTVERRGELYDFYESIVNALRPAFKEGIRSIVIAAPARTDHARSFLDHVRKHHTWLVRGGPNVVTFGELIGAAGQPHAVHELVRTKAFRQMIGETTTRDADNIAAALEKGLSSENSGSVVSYSLEQIEDLVYSQEGHASIKPEHVVLTDKYLADAKNKARILRLLQISRNKGIKTTVIGGETRAGARLSQLGGLACFAKRKP
jgi:stalled ribosome rescue protein Dom34